MEALIIESEDPMAAMEELASSAERGGLIDNSNVPRRSEPWIFVLDLLIDNPDAADWFSCRLEFLKNPSDFEEIADLAEHLL